MKQGGQEVNDPSPKGESTNCPTTPSILSDPPITGYVSEADIVTIQSDSDTDTSDSDTDIRTICEPKVVTQPPIANTPGRESEVHPWEQWEREDKAYRNLTFAAQHSGNPTPFYSLLLRNKQREDQLKQRAAAVTATVKLQLHPDAQQVVSSSQAQLSPEQREDKLNKDIEEAVVDSLLTAIDASHNRYYNHEPLQQKLEAQRADWLRQLKEICSKWDNMNPTLADAMSGREGMVTKPGDDPTDSGHGSLPHANHYIATGVPQKPCRQYKPSPS